eukprot:comp22218_c0_seq1/m.32715 comp22218_c0_seq1/g.32715  ORF comp22218_c0_seq1/g.32715 comp22218_c0_seq1/m.32715 type:complete len:1123 (-) comp22218_c0_seq1:468-3836(-)
MSDAGARPKRRLGPGPSAAQRGGGAARQGLGPGRGRSAGRGGRRPQDGTEPAASGVSESTPHAPQQPPPSVLPTSTPVDNMAPSTASPDSDLKPIGSEALPVASGDSRGRGRGTQRGGASRNKGDGRTGKAKERADGGKEGGGRRPSKPNARKTGDGGRKSEEAGTGGEGGAVGDGSTSGNASDTTNTNADSENSARPSNTEESSAPAGVVAGVKDSKHTERSVERSSKPKDESRRQGRGDGSKPDSTRKSKSPPVLADGASPISELGGELVNPPSVDQSTREQTSRMPKSDGKTPRRGSTTGEASREEKKRAEGSSARKREGEGAGGKRKETGATGGGRRRGEREEAGGSGTLNDSVAAYSLVKPPTDSAIRKLSATKPGGSDVSNDAHGLDGPAEGIHRPKPGSGYTDAGNSISGTERSIDGAPRHRAIAAPVAGRVHDQHSRLPDPKSNEVARGRMGEGARDGREGGAERLGGPDKWTEFSGRKADSKGGARRESTDWRDRGESREWGRKGEGSEHRSDSREEREKWAWRGDTSDSRGWGSTGSTGRAQLDSSRAEPHRTTRDDASHSDGSKRANGVVSGPDPTHGPIVSPGTHNSGGTGAVDMLDRRKDAGGVSFRAASSAPSTPQRPAAVSRSIDLPPATAPQLSRSHTNSPDPPSRTPVFRTNLSERFAQAAKEQQQEHGTSGVSFTSHSTEHVLAPTHHTTLSAESLGHPLWRKMSNEPRLDWADEVDVSESEHTGDEVGVAGRSEAGNLAITPPSPKRRHSGSSIRLSTTNPSIPLQPAMTSARRPLTQRPPHSPHVPASTTTPPAPLSAAKKSLRDKSRSEKPIYVPRHRRNQAEGGTDSTAEDEREGRSANESGGGEDDTSPTGDDLGSSSETTGGETGKPDRRALILSFINNAGKDDVIVYEQSKADTKARHSDVEEWELHHDLDSEPDLPPGPSHGHSDSEAMSGVHSISGGAHSNVLELYGFGTDIMTQHLRSILAPYATTVEFRWVDDTHALAIFKSADIAHQVHLDQARLPLRTRLFKDAGPAAQRKLERYSKGAGAASADRKERPVTTAAVASRLVGGALGITVRRTQEQIAADREKMQKEREKRDATRQQAAQQQHEVDSAFDLG